jgi:probable rRNA maturation factor
MTYYAEVVSDPASRGSEAAVRQAALAALAFEEAPEGSLSIVLATGAELRALNRQFRQEDTVTDVLAFPDGSQNPEGEGIYFGDVVIAVDVAQGQADHAGHPLESELVLLTVHGVLHLLGHDHGTQAEKDSMWSRQAAILRGLPIKVRLPA